MRGVKEINYWLQVVVRSVFGGGILLYGTSKILGAQFQVPAFQYSRPLAEIPGYYLVWAFLGYSPGFQRFLGFVEAIPGILLFFRCTQRLGAILLFPVLLNVLLVNIAYDLWPGTKIISATMLGLCLYLIASDFPAYRAILSTLVQKPSLFERPLAGRIENMISAITAGSAILLAAVFGFGLLRDMRPWKDFIGDRQINRAGDWVVEELTVAGESVLPQAPVHLYFDFAQDCYYQVQGGVEQHCAFTADSALHTFSILALRVGDGSAPIAGNYREEGERLNLTGMREGRLVQILLRRANWGRTL